MTDVYSNAIAVAGTILNRGNSDGSYTTVAEVIDIDGPEDKVSLINVTTTQSPDNEEEWIPGQKGNGAVKLTMNYVPQDPGMLNIVSDRKNRVRSSWQIKMSDALHTTKTFLGFVTSISPMFKMGDKLAVTVSIQPTGGVTETHD